VRTFASFFSTLLVFERRRFEYQNKARYLKSKTNLVSTYSLLKFGAVRSTHPENRPGIWAPVKNWTTKMY